MEYQPLTSPQLNYLRNRILNIRRNIQYLKDELLNLEWNYFTENNCIPYDYDNINNTYLFDVAGNILESQNQYQNQ